ncbi:MAG TPA: GNAT family protein [Anaerolineales bacterium]|nr:GNAT family protein [Anaerolineales bacterium]
MTEQIPGPAYQIFTHRLLLRCWQPTDAAQLGAVIEANITHLLPWLNFAADEPRPLEERIGMLRRWRGNFDLGQDFVYGVFSRDGKNILGSTGLHTRQGIDTREIGYWIDQGHANQGLATELSAALTKVAFEIDHVRRVEIHCDVLNQASAAVSRKLGYRHEATLHARTTDHQGRPREMMIWTLFADEYSASPSAKAEIEAYDVVGRRIL